MRVCMYMYMYIATQLNTELEAGPRKVPVWKVLRHKQIYRYMYASVLYVYIERDRERQR